MSPLYTSINKIVRELTDLPFGKNGVARHQDEMWTSINGVKRQIFSNVKMATWQKWDIKLTYTYTRAVKYNTIVYGLRPGYAFPGYSTTNPRITGLSYSTRPDDIFDIFIGLSKTNQKMDEVIQNTGYYLTYGSTSSPTLCTVLQLSAGEMLTYRSSNNWDLPDQRALYYPSEKKTKSKGSTLIETITAPEGTYPDNGASGDYWYVRI